jgi:putative zinc finger protein
MQAGLNCIAATRLLSDEHERSLTRQEQTSLEAHLEICPACVECGLQFRVLSRIAVAWREHGLLDDR